MQQSLKQQRLKLLISGICGLMLALGIARFAYTPLMPLMQEQTHLSLAAGGWLASINYLGYLSGLILAASTSSWRYKFWFYRLGLIAGVLTTIAMAMADNIYLWATMRYLAGLSSACGVMFGSGLILHWLRQNHFRGELGVHFSGAGLGIAACALWLLIFEQYFNWAEHWLWLGAIGALLAYPAWHWLPAPTNAQSTPHNSSQIRRAPNRLFMRLFMGFYGCAGIGYVILATFIVAIVEQSAQSGNTSSSNLGAQVFLVMGLAAAPACVIWDRIARRLGDLTTLALLSSIHLAASALPLFSSQLWMGYTSAALFGFTFIGLVSMVLTMVGHYFPEAPAKMMGKITLWYALAQIIAPAITGELAEITGSYLSGLWLGSGAMVVALLILPIMSWAYRR